MEAREHTQANLSLLREKLGSGRVQSAQMLIGSLHPSEVARLLESLPQTERFLIWEMVIIIIFITNDNKSCLIQGFNEH